MIWSGDIHGQPFDFRSEETHPFSIFTESQFRSRRQLSLFSFKYKMIIVDTFVVTSAVKKKRIYYLLNRL